MIAKSITRTITTVLVIFALVAVSAAGFYFGFTYVLSQNARFDHYDELYGEFGFVPDDLVIAIDLPDDVDLETLLNFLNPLQIALGPVPEQLWIPAETNTAGLPRYLEENDITFDAATDGDSFADGESLVNISLSDGADINALRLYFDTLGIELLPLPNQLLIPHSADTGRLPEFLSEQGIAFAGAYNESGFLRNDDIIEFYIPRGADTKEIADLLKENEVIANTFVFTILSKFNGFDGAYMAGTHFVYPDMSYDEIMYSLVQKPQSVRVTFPEGLTYKEVKQILRQAQVNFDEEILDEMVDNPILFLDFEFVRQIQIREGRDWLLQGYLFPDTYEFDLNTDEETIIRTFLNNTERKLNEGNGQFYSRAEELNLSMDEIITLASIVQMETQDSQEMRSVAGVYDKRMREEGWTLSADPTINYIRKERGLDPVLWLSTRELDQFRFNRYNTYYHAGLPPGPICSPGRDAILAALYPESNPYYYFSAAYDGSTVFAATLAEHERNILRYQEEIATQESEASEAENTEADTADE